MVRVCGISAEPQTPDMDMHGFDTLKLPLDTNEWYDADERMFQACFEVLRQFVEDELGPDENGDGYRGFRLHSADIEPGDPSGMPPRRSSDRDAIDLWLWYRDELPRVEQEYADEVHRRFGGDDVMTTVPTDNPMLREIIIKPKGEAKFPYDYPEIVKDEKLGKLIALRRALWT